MNQTKFFRNNLYKSIIFVCFVCLFAVAVINTANADANLSASITASNSITGSSVVSVGQTITVTMTVTNTGDAVANDVTPSELEVAGDGIASKSSDPIPPKSNIPAGESQDFTWTYSADAAGVVTFSATASGSGAVGKITSTKATSNDVTIQIPATLEIISITAEATGNPIPTQVNVGQTITVEMKVKNIGQATAEDVKPSVTSSGSGGVSYSAGPNPISATLKVGEGLTFRWTYKADTFGTIIFSGEVSGTDVNSSQFVTSEILGAEEVIIQTPATISIAEFTAGHPGNPITSQITEGQEITITMTVTNTGQAMAKNVAPTVQKRVDSTGDATHVSGPEPDSADVEGEGSVTFTWIYSTTAGNSGTVRFSGSVAGKDFNTGINLSAEDASNNVVIQTPPNLTASLKAEHPGNAQPTQISEGQTITVTMTIQNTGGATAKGVKPSELKVAGNATLDSPPDPSEYDILAEESRTFTWIYNTATGSAGSITFSGCASGTDFNSGNSIKTSDIISNSITIQTPAHLEITSLRAENPKNPIKIQLSEGQSITLIMVVKNSGQATAKDVYVNTPSWPGPGTATLTNPAPEKATIAGGREQTFKWNWITTSDTAADNLVFAASATGTDFNFNVTDDVHISEAYSNSIKIQTPAKLIVKSIKAEHPGNPNPFQIIEGQTITVTMSVINEGQAKATDVRVETPNWPGSGVANLTFSPEPSSVDIPGSGSQNFTWIWTTTLGTAGIVQFSNKIIGRDYNSRFELSSVGISNSILIKTSPQLRASIDAKHPGNEIETQISEGQNITVSMTVANNGDETANNVTPPEQLIVAGSGNATYESGPEPKFRSIEGHSSATFKWTYTTTKGDSGYVTFSGDAIGTIGYKTWDVISTPEVTSNPITIQTPVQLEILSLTAEHPGNSNPYQISEGQSITLTMMIKNTGEAKAVKVTPAAKLLTGNLVPVTITSPTDIKSGESSTFIWTYNTGPATSGNVSFWGSASGTDFNSRETKSVFQNSNSVLIQKPANIFISNFIAEHPGNPNTHQISEGQTIICTVTVTNRGEAKANGVSIDTPTWPGFGSANLISAPSPSSSDIGGEGKETYTWIWETKLGTAGTITFSANASGTDFNSGVTTTAYNSSNSMLIQTPPNLKVTLDAKHEGNRKPTQISEGQEITVTMIVTNSGQASAKNVIPSAQLQVNGAGNATYKSGPSPNNPLIIEGGDTKSFTWTYDTTTGNAGEITFSAKASGYDYNSSKYVSVPDTTSNSILIQIPATLKITELTAGNPGNPKHDQVSEGQNITVGMTVSNIGEAKAVDVLPQELKLESFPDDKLELNKSPLKQDIDGGTHHIFEWVYKTIPSGDEPNYEIDDTVNFTRSAAWEDFNSREIKTSTSKTSNEVIVQIPAILKAEFKLATFDVRPKIDGPQIFENMDFEVKMNIENFGEATAKNIQPEPILITSEGAGTPYLDDGPLPPNADIEGGQIQTYIWKYSTKEQKSASKSYFKTVAVGEDFNSKEKIVTDDTAQSDIIDILMDEPPPNTLSSVITVDKTELSGGQNITVTMTVGNNREQDDISEVTPQLIISEGENNIEPIGDPIPSEPQFILGNKKQGYKEIEYTWRVTTKVRPGGKVKFRGIAQGKVSDTDVNVKSIPGEKEIFIQTPAKLSADLKIQQEQLSVEQIFEVKMTVKNEGQATAINVKPSELIYGENVKQLEKPEPQDIPGGESRNYVWEYIAIAKGNIAFTGEASGSDENSLQKVTSHQVTSNSVGIVPPSKLDAKLNITPRPISVGQTFTVTMIVTNKENVADAINVKPSLDISNKASEQSGPTKEFGPIPPIADIPAGGSQMYSWHYTTAKGDAAVVTFTGKAEGIDANTGKPVESDDTIQLIIQKQAHLLIPQNGFNVESKSVITGQDITVKLKVENDGEAIAENVQPSIQLLGTSKLVTDAVKGGPRPPEHFASSEGALGDEPRTFTWVYKTQNGDAGNIQFKTSVSGKDGNSQMLLQSQESMARVEIKTPADISCVLKAEPQVVSEGQDIEITMTVTNIGESTIIDVRPSDLTVEGFDESLSSSFEGETIERYQSKEFTWVYIPEEGSAGKITLSAYVTGKDKISGNNIKSANCEVEVTVEKPAALSSEIAANPTLISAGQEITVTMTVTNDGKATAKEVTPSKLSLSGKASATSGPILRDGPKPAEADIPGGESREFIWRYTTAKGDAPADVTFTGNAEGIDVNSGEKIPPSEATSTGKVKIQTPAQLEITSLTAAPPVISEGQIIEFIIKLKNSGQASAINITLSLPEFIIGRLINPKPVGSYQSNIDELGGGGEQELTWTFQTQGKDANHPGDAGKVIFEIRATGYDQNSKKLVQSEEKRSNEVPIQVPANLKVELKTDLRKVSGGMSISGVMIVKNTGEAKAIEVQSPEVMGLRLTIQIDEKEPQPIEITQEPVEIKDGETKEFPWSYTTPGDIKEKVQVFFDGAVAGKDGNSEMPIEATAQRLAVTIIPRSSLEISGFDVSPKQITEGQYITVKMTVKNVGEATVTNVKAGKLDEPKPLELEVLGTGNATFDFGPSDEGKPIAPGDETIYVWRYSTTDGSAGEITFKGHAEGKDGLSEKPISSGEYVTSPAVTIQRPAHLISEVNTARKISEGQKITVMLTVKNDGGATAIQVTPSLELAGTSNLKSKAPHQAPSTMTIDYLEGGGKHDFEWVYQTRTEYGSQRGDAGTVIFIADAHGYDENTRKLVQSEKDTSPEVAIQRPARLDVTLEAKPKTISLGQSVTITMTVTNIGQATAIDVTAPEKLEVVGQEERAELVSQQVVEELSEGEIQFQWTYATKDKMAGTIQFQGHVEAEDENTRAPVYSDTAKSNFVAIQRPASLQCDDISIIQPQPDESGERKISEGQDIIIEFKVTNTDNVQPTGSAQATAREIKPYIEVFSGESQIYKDNLSSRDTLRAGQSYAGRWTYTKGDAGTTGTRQVFFKLTVTGRDTNSQKEVKCEKSSLPEAVIIQRPSFIQITGIEPEKESIGIEQSFKVTVSVKNTGEATAEIRPNKGDLSLILLSENRVLIPDEEYFITPENDENDELSLEGGKAHPIVYNLLTIEGKTPSGDIAIDIKQLAIVDANNPNQSIGFDKPADVKAEISVDMEPPQLEEVLYEDTNTKGVVEAEDKLILTFNEKMKVKDLSADDFALYPDDNSLGINPRYSADARTVIITLGDNPKLSPEGIYDATSDSSGIGTKVRDYHLVDLAGNMSLDSERLLDIDITDNKPPKVVSASLSNENTNETPSFFLKLTDESDGLDSGIDLNKLEFLLDGFPIKERVIDYPSVPEYLPDGTEVTAITELFSAPSQAPDVHLIQKDVVLKVTFNKKLGYGAHELEITIKDNKGNVIEPSPKITFNVVSPPSEEPIIDLATYPNPFSPGKGEKAVIRYVLSTDVDDVTIKVYDASSRLVRIFKTSGRQGLNHDIKWDGKTESGEEVAAGVYICELTGAGQRIYWAIVVGPSFKLR